MTGENAADAPAELRFKVEGMDCPSCIRKIETALGRVPGVSDVNVNFATEILSLRVAAGGPPSDAIRGRVRALGFSASPIDGRLAPAAPPPSGHEDAHGHDHGHHHHGRDHHDHSHDHDGHAHHHGHAHEGHAQVEPVAARGGEVGERRWWQTAKGQLVLSTGVLLAAAFALSEIVPEIGRWGYLAAMVIGVVPIARRAFALAQSGSPFSIEMLMSIAALGAVAIGATQEAALVVFLFAVGELLEGVAAGRARASIKALAGLVPRRALVEAAGAARDVPVESLKIGDIVLVRPGERVPADGAVVDGESAVDESPITGESMPRAKAVGDDVFAGSINASAALRVRVAKAAADNTIARIVRLVEEADAAKAPTARFIDRFSEIYTPAVILVALAVALGPPLLLAAPWYDWIYRALTLLLIACPCALVISTPAAITSGLSAGARRGLLMKGGVVLEAMSKVRIIAFDKTGTLTQGRPQVTDVVGFGRPESEVATLAAAVETGSNHPLASAILRHAAVLGLAVPTASAQHAIAGKTVSARVDGREIVVGSPRHLAADGDAAAAIDRLEAEGKTVVGVRDDGAIIGVIALRDEPRADAKSGLALLRMLGVEAVMLTGDNARTARAIAGDLDLEPRAELLPEDKVTAVRELAARAPVAKVGDGINDAPALAAASVGIAMGSGTDVALETAGAAILNSRIADIAVLVRLARATMANIRQNVAVALGLKAIFLVTSVAGITSLWIAVLADTGATVLVTINAMRLLRFK
ncbi:MAG: cadmium-translocating P-type ATPase [Alphaproteobacteria bacterium]|nr:cadmium-translocating P-type ATPase [Alphaproteobacteria bacterium]